MKRLRFWKEGGRKEGLERKEKRKETSSVLKGRRKERRDRKTKRKEGKKR
jgi:hypothetical protein